MQLDSKAVAVALSFSFASVVYGADWEFGGYSTEGKDGFYQFFDGAGIERPSGNVARVWVKAIRVKSLERYSTKHSKDVVEKTARKIAFGYVPRLFQLADIRRRYDSAKLQDAIIDAAQYEVVANEIVVQTRHKIYFEFDCDGHRWKMLHGVTYGPKGDVVKSRTSQQGAYEFVVPETNGDWLRQIVCAK